MFLTRKEIKQHLEAIAVQMDMCTPDMYCNCEYVETMHEYIGELYALAEDICPTVTEEQDQDAIREAVRETQYGCGN